MWSAARLARTLIFAVYAASALAADALPHLTGKQVNVTVTDMSPMMIYSPSSSGPMDSAWNQTWTNASWAQYTPLWPVDRLDDGTMPVSAHTTRSTSASASISFMGTAVYFYGMAQGSFSHEAGGQTTEVKLESSTTGLLASATGLANVAQEAKITLLSGEITINHVVVTVEVGGAGATIVNSTFMSYDETDQFYLLGSNMTWSQETQNEWYMNSTTCGEFKTPTSEGSSCWVSPRAQTNVPKASFKFNPPASSSFISLYTTTGYQQGPFTVTLDPPLFDGPASWSYTEGNPWLAQPDVLMFFTPLDFRKQYTVTVEFTGSAEQYLDFRYGRYLTTSGGDMTQPQGTTNGSTTGSTTGGSKPDSTSGTGSSNSGASTKSSTPIGAIVGGVVGGIVALVALALAIFFCCRRRKHTGDDDAVPLEEAKRRPKPRGGFLRRPPSGLSNFEVDVSDKPVYNMDGSVSHPSLVGSEADVTPLVIPPTVTPMSGMSAAEQKASEAAREAAAAQPAVQPAAPVYTYPPSSAGQSSGAGSASGPASSNDHMSSPTSQTGSGFRTYPSSAATHSPHGQPFLPSLSNHTAPMSDYPLSHVHSSPISPVSNATWTTFGAHPQTQPQSSGSNAYHPALSPLADHGSVTEEVDAGRLVQTKKSVPPRYNPAWAEEDGSAR